jgi:hypothetical protein
MLIFGRLPGEPTGSSALSTPNFRPIRRYLAPDLTVGSANGWRCSNEKKMWTKLWKIQVPSKIKIFLWRLSQHSLPTGDIRHHWQMAPSSACLLCGQEDSWRHSLMECAMSRCIWALVDPVTVEHISLSSETSTRLWLFFMINSMDKSDLTRMLDVVGCLACETEGYSQRNIPESTHNIGVRGELPPRAGSGSSTKTGSSDNEPPKGGSKMGSPTVRFMQNLC